MCRTDWVRGACLLSALLLTTLLSPDLARAAGDVVSRAQAIAFAEKVLVDEALYEPEFVKGLDAKVTSATVNGHDYLLVEFMDAEGIESDSVVLTPEGVYVTDRRTLQALGAWDSLLSRVGFASDWGWASAGIAFGLGAAFLALRWMRKPRIGWRAWLVNAGVSVLVVVYLAGLISSVVIGDVRGAITGGVPFIAITVAVVVALLRRKRYAVVELPPAASDVVDGRAAGALGSDAASGGSSLAGVPASAPGPALAGPGGKLRPGSGKPVGLKVIAPENLPTFTDVGGMDEVKQQLRETVGLLVSHGDLARRYGIDWNGVLLYGPPGVGKTFMAKAAAGEFGLSFIDVRVADLLSSYVGESSKQVASVFGAAAKHRPCILFFDEFDSVAQRREDASWDRESTRVVNQLLRELESAREVPDLIVMAATNHKATLDEAVIRPGRFDRHIEIPLPDDRARLRVFEAQLAGRPVEGDIDLQGLVQRTSGMSAADISAVVNGAALEAMRRSIAGGDASGGAEVPIDEAALVQALEELRAKVKPSVALATWEDLVLAPETRRKLEELQRQIEHSEELALRGIEVPRGILLYGPPGTGKTTIARVLASQANVSFFAVDASEIVSMWVGETEKNISRLFDEARRHRPSIVFIDEIDSLVSARAGESGIGDDITSQFLREIDGVMGSSGVFVIGATNIPSALDPALLRGGRLARQMLIPPPDAAGREALFRVHARRMLLAGDVDFAVLAAETEGLTGADIKEVCNAAGLLSFERGATEVAAGDFEQARGAYASDRRPFDVPDWMARSWDAPVKDKTPFGFRIARMPGDGDESPASQEPAPGGE